MPGLFLTLIRHAKSLPWATGQPDDERALNPQGEEDGRRMALWCKQQLPTPDLWLISPAKRTQQTASLLMATMPPEGRGQRIEPLLYGSSVNSILALLAEQDNAHEHLLVLGHNPDISEVANVLATDTATLPFGFPTLGIAHFRMQIADWSELTEKCAEPVQFMTPKLLSKTKA